MVKIPIWPKFKGMKDVDLELSRVKKLLNLAQNPEKKLSNVIHVAGTNGKGSTSAFLRSFLLAAGYSVNLYSSPHLLNFNERINLNGVDISDEELHKLSLKYQKISTEHNLSITFFEGTTVMALDAFARFKANYNIIEVGLGGRLDATNIFEQKLAQIITPISHDHQEFLGDNIIDIAHEKAAIIKTNSKLFIGKQVKSVKDLLVKIAEEKKCEINFYQDYQEALPSNLGLDGEHQKENFKLAATVFSNLTKQKIKQDYKNFLSWPARLQNITKNIKEKYSNFNQQAFLDGGHNIDAAKALKSFIKEKNISHIIIAMVLRKDIKNFLTILQETSAKIYLTEITHNDESIRVNNLDEDLVSVETYKSYHLAFNKILADKNYHNILFAGSLFFAAEILQDLS